MIRNSVCLQQHAYPASRWISALRVSFLFFPKALSSVNNYSCLMLRLISLIFLFLVLAKKSELKM